MMWMIGKIQVNFGCSWIKQQENYLMDLAMEITVYKMERFVCKTHISMINNLSLCEMNILDILVLKKRVFCVMHDCTKMGYGLQL